MKKVPLVKKPMPLYIEAYLYAPSEDLVDACIDIIDRVPFNNLSIPVKAIRGMVDLEVPEDKYNKIIELGNISSYYPKNGTFSIKIADYYRDIVASMISDDKAFIITPFIAVNSKNGNARILKFTVEHKNKSELSSSSTSYGVNE